MRAGAYLGRDVIIGLVTMVIILEAARRASRYGTFCYSDMFFTI